jgi:hypothetical protein
MAAWVACPHLCWLRDHKAEIRLGRALASSGITRPGDMTVQDAPDRSASVATLTARRFQESDPTNAIMLGGGNRLPRVRAFLDFPVESLQDRQALRLQPNN